MSMDAMRASRFEGNSFTLHASILEIVCMVRIAAANAQQAYETKVLDPP